MHTDCAFRMGKTHIICEDYVLARNGERAYVLLADGCSSSPDTDIGARLLVRSAEAALQAHWDLSNTPDNAMFEAYHAEAICAARAHAEALGLSDTALDATLLTAVADQDSWRVALCGDGVVVIGGTETLQVISVSYLENHPYYLNYTADERRHQVFKNLGGNLQKREEVWIYPDGTVEEKETREEEAEKPCLWFTGANQDSHWIAVLSDGVHSFVETTDTETARVSAPIPFYAVLRELLAFKSLSGQFVQRRMQRFLQRCAERGWQHRDDLSLGVLVLGGAIRLVPPSARTCSGEGGGG